MDGKTPDLNRKAFAATILTLAVLFSVLLGLAPGLLDENTLKTRTLDFRANGTALNTSGNRTVNLGVATGEGLSFGRIPVKGKSTKYFNISAGKKALLFIDAEGNISGQLDYDRKHYFKGRKEVDLVFNPEDVGSYSGNVSVTVNVAKNEVGAKWLALKAKLY